MIGLETELMTPTGDYVADVSTDCTRYERRLGLRRPEQERSPAEDRRFALVVARCDAAVRPRVSAR